MSQRDPNLDWEQPRLESSRGGSPHYSGSPHQGGETPLAASAWARNKRLIVPVVVAVLLLVAGVIVFLLAGD
jgi:hypothetical protein